MDGLLWQAKEVARAAHARGVHLAEGHAAHIGGAVVHGLLFQALHIFGVAVGIAVIQAVHHKGRAHLLHLHMVEHDIIDHAILAAAAPGLHAKAAVGVAHQAVLHAHVLHAARHFAAHGHAAVAVLHQAVDDLNVLAGRGVGGAHIQFARLDGNAVVPQGEVRTRHQNALAALRVKAIGVGAVGRGLHGNVQEFQVVAEIGVQIPRRAVAEGDALHGHVFAAAQVEQPWPPCAALDAGRDPPVAVRRHAVGNALAVDHHVLHIHAGEQGAKHIQRVALPGAQVEVALLVGGLDHPRQDGEQAPVPLQLQGRALLQLQADVALQEQRLHPILARRDQHPPLLRAAGDGRLDGRGVVMHTVAQGSKLPHIHGEALFLRAELGFAQHFFAIPGLQAVLRVRPQPVQAGDHRVRRASVLAVQRQPIGLLRGIQPAVGQLYRHAAGRTKQHLHLHAPHLPASAFSAASIYGMPTSRPWCSACASSSPLAR